MVLSAHCGASLHNVTLRVNKGNCEIKTLKGPRMKKHFYFGFDV